MAITTAQKSAIEDIINIIISATPAPPSRGKRRLSAMFMDLVDRTEWPEYYEVIPEPRCINAVQASVEKNRYKDPSHAYTDLSLVFWNAMFYNEPTSQIAMDAEALKTILEAEWQKRSILPIPRHSPPPSSPQKVHGIIPAPVPESTTVQITSSVNNQKTTPVGPAPASLSINAEVRTQKPFHPRSKSPQQVSSPDMEVDVSGMSPEPEGQTEDINIGTGVSEERDAESDEIVKQLEKGLPKWEGFGDSGWMSEVSKDRLLEIVYAIKTYKDVIGNRLAVALEAVPEESTSTNLSFHSPLSLKSIEGQVRSQSYESSKDFDCDMARLFEKARRWHEPCSEPYGRVLLLQRLYQALTSSSPPQGPPYTSTTNFASVRAGPGTARPLHSTDSEGVPGVTTFRVSTKDRSFVEEVHYKGWSIRLADWLHLSNPDDPSRPIIAQVFKCWVSDEPTKKGQPGLTICWYYRPEQTFHLAQRLFWEGEVFKTSHFADHPLEDVIEKIACQFTARHIRGRPRPPFWYPGWPLYVCDSRYNDRERVFVKIKNWNSCVPEEVRKSTEFMPIYPFERVVFPRRFPSPFLAKGGKVGAVKGPGGITENVEKSEAEKAEGPSKGLYVGAPSGQGATAPPTTVFHYPPPQQTQPHRSQPNTDDSRDRTLLTAAAGSTGAAPLIEKLPAETTKHFDRSPETNEIFWFSAPPMNIPRPPEPKHSLAYLHFLASKKKNEAISNDNGMDVDDDLPEAPAKRQCVKVPPTVTATLHSVLAEMTKPTV
ncbi:hypothetical protein SERLA73DRAFT_96993 [Serpula lacrymans var. lacrymans S7.3]|uniref:BAH domain-containing protein n=1 Tax=Serpula lacrymans var. lacrymans (strain S7.3) TaxID=936435 RepID=F8QC40_SERL3|nr:hypothetical protein SERLA73DRAFT_96993 [Serpula lacrymans var. lacrymans S7.3]